MKYLNRLPLYLLLTFIAFSCSSDDDGTDVVDNTDIVVVVVDSDVISVDESNFTSGLTITTIPCTLSDGTSGDCYKIETASVATDHDMGPWCPSTINDDEEAGGIWLDEGEVYNVDGEFIKNLATFYGDDIWKMYDENDNVFITDTEDDCTNAADPSVTFEEYGNYCVECAPEYLTNLTQTWVIPVTPVAQDEPYQLDSMDRNSTVPSTRGVALNGMEFSASAPVDNILAAYTIAPFDDAGGHINVHQGYHYHAATEGIEARHTITQDDSHSKLIGYAMDGFGIYSSDFSNDNEPADLDDCRGHSDDTRGYHYHVDYAGNNNFIDCLKGAYVVDY